MPDFKIPTLPSNLQAGGLTLSVRSTFDLSDYESEVLQQSLGDSFFGHTTLRDYIQYGKGAGEIRGTIGSHEGRERQEDLFEETPTQRNWVHYTLTFTEGARGTSK